MAENMTASEPPGGMNEGACDKDDFQCFEDEILEIFCPKVSFNKYIMSISLDFLLKACISGRLE